MKVILGTIGIIAAATAAYGVIRSYGRLIFTSLFTYLLKTSYRQPRTKVIHEGVPGGHERAGSGTKDESNYRLAHWLSLTTSLC